MDELRATTDPVRATARPREIFAWAMYDWANSAYSTLSITILCLYLTKVVFRPDDVWGATIWSWGIGLSMLMAALLSPVLGALADANRSKRAWLAATALPGAAAVVLLAALPSDRTWLIVATFVAVSFFFELSLGFYNGFLPEITDETTINRVSAWGYALGYLGGALALVLALLVIRNAEWLGLPTYAEGETPTVPLRIGVLIMGLWWGLFTLPTLWILRDRGQRPEQKLPARQAVRRATGEVVRTLRNVRRYRMLAIFLLAFLFFNDGVQATISQSSIFATKTPELNFKPEQLIGLILMIQFVALPGSLLVGWLADRLGQKPTLTMCLGIWVALIVAARFVATPMQFWILGAILALVLGGTQSVSRAIMGRMTPEKHTAEFFGFYNLSGKATGVQGTLLFGLIYNLTENTRWAILSILVSFVVGWIIFSRVDIEEGRRQALGE